MSYPQRGGGARWILPPLLGALLLSIGTLQERGAGAPAADLRGLDGALPLSFDAGIRSISETPPSAPAEAGTEASRLVAPTSRSELSCVDPDASRAPDLARLPAKTAPSTPSLPPVPSGEDA